MRVAKILFFLILIFYSCQQKKDTSVQLMVNYQELSKNSIGLMMYKGALFTGVSNKYQSDGETLIAVYTYKNGLKHGHVKRWYNNGVLNYETSYQQGRKHGAIKIWYGNGQLQKETTYFKGVVHGIEKTWYPDGKKLTCKNLIYGREQGMQQAWRRTGKLYANYEAVNGRIFGLRNANMCYKLEKETVVK